MECGIARTNSRTAWASQATIRSRAAERTASSNRDTIRAAFWPPKPMLSLST